MNLNNTFGSQDFTTSIVDGIPVLKLNIFRATIKDTQSFKSNLVQLMTANHRFIILDFTECHFIDSAIVGVMVIMVKELRKNNGDILTIVSEGAINNLFVQTGLDRVFKRFNNISSALASLSM